MAIASARLAQSLMLAACSKNLWLETTITDSLTLRQQSEHGREIPTDNKKNDFGKDDYELSRDAGH